MPDKKTIMIVAGEASGDQHGARVIRELKRENPSYSYVGIGGAALSKEGVHCIVDSKTLSVVGITEVILRLPSLLKGIGKARDFLKKERPDLLILIDFPDFNLYLAKIAKKYGIPVLYYISPQIWAWRKNRVKKIKQRVDHMAVIFPFEVKFYKSYGVPVTFVGHPLAEDIVSSSPLKEDGSHNEELVVSLLPGSRDREVQMLLAVMVEAAEKISRNFKQVKFVVSCAPSVDKKIIQEILSSHGKGLDIRISYDSVENVFNESTVTIAASGTVTLQAAIYGAPHVIIYKVSPLSYALAKLLVRIDHIGLVNLISEKRVVPELVQDEANADTIADAIIDLLKDEPKRMAMKSELIKVRNRLGESGASKRVASLAKALLDRKTEQ